MQQYSTQKAADFSYAEQNIIFDQTLQLTKPWFSL